jgi:hypothetical protein
MSYKRDFAVSIEEANYKLANDLIRDNIRLEKMLESALDRLDDQARLIADLSASVERIREYLKTEYAKKQPAKSA